MKVIEDTYQLSPMQQGMLFHCLCSPQSGMYIEQMIGDLHEALNVSAFKQAWQRVIERHDILRTSFCWEGLSEPLQEVRPSVTLPFEQQDWSTLPLKEQEEELEVYLGSDRRRAFNLTEAPLMRLALFRLAEAQYQFIWTFHHALLDGRSFPLVLKEVFAFYEAYCEGEELRLDQPRPYRDYIGWLQQQDMSKAELFWREMLTGFTAPIPLGVNQRRSGLLDGEESFGKQRIRLSTTTTASLHSLAQQHELTLNTIVQGAWAILLSRYCGEEDVVFGATRACRHFPVDQANSMVGIFINTLPIRAHVSPEKSVLTWLKELRTKQVVARAYEHTPLVKIQEWSDVRRGKPLFESLLVFENYQLSSTLQDQGGSWEKREFRLLQQTNYPLTIAAYSGPELWLKIAYDRSRFDDDAIRRMLGHYQNLLEAIVADPQKRLSELPIVTGAERDQLVVQWNNTRTEYPQDTTIHKLFEAQVECTPEAVAVVYENNQLSYSELNQRANQVAHHLKRLGVGPEVTVGISIDRSMELMIGLLGIFKAGGAYVPVDPKDPPERVRFVLEDAAVSVLLTQARWLESLPVVMTKVVCLDRDWERIEQEGKENADGKVNSENLAYVLYTSGSTGKPKGALIEHRSLVNYLCWVNQSLLSEGVHIMPVVTGPGFDASLKQLFAPLLRGGTVWLLSDDVASQTSQLIQTLGTRTKVGLNCVPSLWSAILDMSDSGQRLSLAQSLSTLFVGGEQLRPDLVERTMAAVPHLRIWNLYGPTETTANVSVARIVSAKSVTIGRPIANAQIHILDRQMQAVPIGVPGELHIGGDGLARGYWKREELTGEKFIPNPFGTKPGARLYKTGDRARYLPDGNIEFLGRLDDQVKVRGYRIELGEIETALTEHAQVREAVVDATKHRGLVAYIVPIAQQAPKSNELRDFLRERLPEYMVPSAFVRLEALPLTSSGKVDRRALPAPEQMRSEAVFVAPRTPVERELANIWSELLGVERIGIYDNFFELGGQSLLLTQLVYRIRENFQVELPLWIIFDVPTIVELTLAIAEKQIHQESTADVAQMLEELKRLSPEELNALLEAEAQSASLDSSN